MFSSWTSYNWANAIVIVCSVVSLPNIDSQCKEYWWTIGRGITESIITSELCNGRSVTNFLNGSEKHNFVQFKTESSLFNQQQHYLHSKKPKPTQTPTPTRSLFHEITFYWMHFWRPSVYKHPRLNDHWLLEQNKDRERASGKCFDCARRRRRCLQKLLGSGEEGGWVPEQSRLQRRRRRRRRCPESWVRRILVKQTLVHTHTHVRFLRLEHLRTAAQQLHKHFPSGALHLVRGVTGSPDRCHFQQKARLLFKLNSKRLLNETT